MSAIRPSFLIVAGAEKCGTTSLFGYLAAHPGTCVSRRKETDYFRQLQVNLAGYLEQFPVAADAQRLHVESSPGYLAEAESVAPRMAAVVPDARLVFVVRDPIDRLRSSFRFYKNRLHVPEAMTFDAFARLCLAHEKGDEFAAPADIKPWHRAALSRGRYERLLRPFEQHFPATQRLVLRHEDLTKDARAAMQSICRFASLDPSFFESFSFERENVSFMARRQGLQRVAILVNDRFEVVWRRFPTLKRRLLGAYKRVNQRPLDKDVLSEGISATLTSWYAPTYRWLGDFHARAELVRDQRHHG
jgi:hypothetical protein